MHQTESVQKNEMHKILSDQSDHVIPSLKPNLVIINQKKERELTVL